MTPSRCAVASFTAFVLLSVTPLAQTQQGALGVFEGSTDVGTAQPGTSTYDAAKPGYQVGGGGDDVWGTADAFRYTWTRVSGDVTLVADVQVSQPGTYPKAKGMLMIRQSLKPGSPYADIAVHAYGHVTLQYRLIQGGETKDTDMAQHGDLRLQIARKGDVYTASVLSDHAGPSPSISLTMRDPAYVGLGACSHSVSALQKVTFSHVQLLAGTGAPR